jgi:hypothetical protein
MAGESRSRTYRILEKESRESRAPALEIRSNKLEADLSKNSHVGSHPLPGALHRLALAAGDARLATPDDRRLWFQHPGRGDE